jgi:hypothetical protein
MLQGRGSASREQQPQLSRALPVHPPPHPPPPHPASRAVSPFFCRSLAVSPTSQLENSWSREAGLEGTPFGGAPRSCARTSTPSPAAAFASCLRPNTPRQAKVSTALWVSEDSDKGGAYRPSAPSGRAERAEQFAPCGDPSGAPPWRSAQRSLACAPRVQTFAARQTTAAPCPKTSPEENPRRHR